MNFNAAYNITLKASIILQYVNSIPPPTNSPPQHTHEPANKERKHSIQKTLESQNTLKKHNVASNLGICL